MRLHGQGSTGAPAPNARTSAPAARAQASLRRACTRLQDRRLIALYYGQRRRVSIFNRFEYRRTRLGLTVKGVEVADSLQDA